MDKNSTLIALHESRDSAFGKLPYPELSPEERVFLHVWELEAEVNNGGFDQYFINSSGNHAAEVVESLEAIGAVQAAAIAKQAISVAFGNSPPPKDEEARDSVMRALPEEKLEQLSACDNEFYLYPDNLTELLFSFVVANKGAIRGAEHI